MKYVDVSPTYKKDNKIDKINFRPISILPNKSKVYERLISKQLNPLAIFFLNYSEGSVKNVILNFDLCPWLKSGCFDLDGHAGGFLT